MRKDDKKKKHLFSDGTFKAISLTLEELKEEWLVYAFLSIALGFFLGVILLFPASKIMVKNNTETTNYYLSLFADESNISNFDDYSSSYDSDIGTYYEIEDGKTHVSLKYDPAGELVKVTYFTYGLLGKCALLGAILVFIFIVGMNFKTYLPYRIKGKGIEW